MGRFSNLEKKTEGKQLDPPAGAVARGSQRSSTDDVPPGEAYPYFIEKAEEAFFTGEYREALKNFSRALQEENHRIYPWIGQIMALIELKQYREAELWSNKALEQFPEDSSLLAQRARVLAVTGNLKRAIGVSDYAVQKGATEWTWLGRGEVLLHAGKNNALFCFEKAVEEAGPDSWKIPFLCGLSFARKRQWANAEQFLVQAVERNSKNHYVWYELTKVLVELNYTERARAAVERIRQLNPNFRKIDEIELRIYRRPFLTRMFGFFKR